MRALSGLLRPVEGRSLLRRRATSRAAPRIASRARAWCSCRKAGRFSRAVGAATTCGSARYPRSDFDRGRDRRDARALSDDRAAQAPARGPAVRRRAADARDRARADRASRKLLLLDEPSLGLAPALINDLFDVLARLRDEGMTILLVDQMAALALAIADRGYVIESGDIVAAGTPDDFAAIARSSARISAKREEEQQHGPRSFAMPASAGDGERAGGHRASTTARSRRSSRSSPRTASEHRSRRPSRHARLRRDAHPSRQVVHPRPLQDARTARSKKPSARLRGEAAFTEDDVYRARIARSRRRSRTARRTCARTSRSIPALGCAGSTACSRPSPTIGGRSTSRSASSRRKA